ncbi:hypothetical protein D6817_02810 [Candidatus Pacearchaeota archaeon]|nr:MAG: hypothetical protein D6817_02810 [Candidatus Pacearchaeota archaeon]
MKQKAALIILHLFAILIFSSNSLAQANENTLYVNVIEQVGNAARVLTNAKVSLTYAQQNEEQPLPPEWKDVPVDENGQVVFLNVQPGVYTITAKSPGYATAQKEFTKEESKPAYLSIALVKSTLNAKGSVRIAILKEHAPQTKEYILDGKIEIMKNGKVIRSSGTESGEVLFTDLPAGIYTASASAPGYKPKQTEFEIKANSEEWLPIILQETGARPSYTTCPKECTCDERTIPTQCYGRGVSEKGVSISTSDAIKKVKDNAVNEISNVEFKQEDGKPSYEITGIKQGRLFFLIPVHIYVKTEIDAKTGKVENIEKPWWSFLVF